MLKYVVESNEENAQRANLDNVHHMLEEIKSNKKLEEAYMQSWEISRFTGLTVGELRQLAESIRKVLTVG